MPWFHMAWVHSLGAVEFWSQLFRQRSKGCKYWSTINVREQLLIVGSWDASSVRPCNNSFPQMMPCTMPCLNIRHSFYCYTTMDVCFLKMGPRAWITCTLEQQGICLLEIVSNKKHCCFKYKILCFLTSPAVVHEGRIRGWVLQGCYEECWVTMNKGTMIAACTPALHF